MARRHQSLIPLSHEHHDGLQLVWRLRIGDLASRDIALRIKHAVAFYEHRLTKHFEAEERALFAAVRAALGAEALMLDNLILEHRELAAKAAALKAGQEAELVPFCNLLEGHIRTEERQLFKLIEERMKPAELDALGPCIKQLLGLS